MKPTTLSLLFLSLAFADDKPKPVEVSEAAKSSGAKALFDLANAQSKKMELQAKYEADAKAANDSITAAMQAWQIAVNAADADCAKGGKKFNAEEFQKSGSYTCKEK
jgi:hypothetical protein